MATDAFLSSLAELRSMPHTHVSEKPVGRAEKPNDFGVLVTLNIPEKKRKQKRFAVTGPKGDRPNLIGRLVLERRQEQEGLPSSRQEQEGGKSALCRHSPTLGLAGQRTQPCWRLKRCSACATVTRAR